MNSERGISSSRNSILLEAKPEEEDKFIVTCSYLLHVIVIYEKIWCVGSIGKFLWKSVILSHSWHLLPPTHVLLKNTYLEFHLHNIIEIKSHTMRRRVMLLVHFTKIQIYVIIEMKFNVVLTTTIENYVGPDIPLCHFIKHANDNLNFQIVFLKISNSSTFVNSIMCLQCSLGMPLNKNHHKKWFISSIA
jgi:hypothetical protein